MAAADRRSTGMFLKVMDEIVPTVFWTDLQTYAMSLESIIR
ncbi:MAG: hypothetical protein ACLRZ7_05360 [Lachnospiraceae bacterium]